MTFDVSDGRCGIIVLIPDHCLPFYFSIIFLSHNMTVSGYDTALDAHFQSSPSMTLDTWYSTQSHFTVRLYWHWFTSPSSIFLQQPVPFLKALVWLSWEWNPKTPWRQSRHSTDCALCQGQHLTSDDLNTFKSSILNSFHTGEGCCRMSLKADTFTNSNSIWKTAMLMFNTVKPIAPNIGTFFKRKALTFFFFLHKNICCGYSLEAPQWGASNEYPQHKF